MSVDNRRASLEHSLRQEAQQHQFTEREIQKALDVAERQWGGNVYLGDAVRAGINSVKVDRERG